MNKICVVCCGNGVGAKCGGKMIVRGCKGTCEECRMTGVMVVGEILSSRVRVLMAGEGCCFGVVLSDGSYRRRSSRYSPTKSVLVYYPF